MFVSECGKEEEDLICKGHFQIVFMSPEALLIDMKWRDMLLSPVYANHLVCISTNRKNIKYIVKDGNDLEVIFEPLAKELRRDRSKTGKTIIFCRSYNDCSHIYLFLKSLWAQKD